MDTNAVRKPFHVTLTLEEYSMLDFIAKRYGVNKAVAFRLMLREKFSAARGLGDYNPEKG